MRALCFSVVLTVLYAGAIAGCIPETSGAGTQVKVHQASSEASPYVPGELLVKFKSEFPKERIPPLLEEMGTQVIRVFDNLGVYHLRITSGESTEAVIQKFSLLKEIEYAEPNYKRKGLN